MRTSWPCWLKQVTEARDRVQSSTTRAFFTPMETIKENVADYSETKHSIISETNHKTNAKRLRPWSVTPKDQKVRVKEVSHKKHAEKWGHATKHCIIKCERIAMATYKPNCLDAVTSSRATQRYATGMSVRMASSTWIAEWSKCCKSSCATLKYTNWIAKRCKWVTREKNRWRFITEGDCKNLIITITISLLSFAPRIERPSRKCVSLTPLYMTTCDFISIIFDIRLKNLVAIFTVKDAKFKVCKYTWATEWQNLAPGMRRIRSSNLS